MEKITVCVLNYNGKEILRKCLESINKQKLVETDIFVIDNASTDDSWKIHKKVIHANNEHKFITGLNESLRVTNSGKIVFMENDIILDQFCLYEMSAVCNMSNIVQPVFYDDHSNLIHGGMKWVWPGYGKSLHKRNKFETDIIATTMFMLYRETFDKIGDFDTNLSPAYYEDVDYSFRAKKLGYSLLIAQKAEVIHLSNFSFSKVMSKRKISKICHRNRKYVVNKHYKGINRFLRIISINFLDFFVSKILRLPR